MMSCYRLQCSDLWISWRQVGHLEILSKLKDRSPISQLPRDYMVAIFDMNIKFDTHIPEKEE